MMKALICPVMLHDKTVFYSAPSISAADKSLSISMAVIIHLVFFIAVGTWFIKPPQFGVDRGLGSIEVNLVAAPSEVTAPVLAPVPVQPKSDFVQKQVAKPVVKPVVKPIEKQVVSKIMGKDKITAQSTGGAITDAKPDYLRNPAPVYPALAQERGYEGVVILKADIDREGNPVNVEIEKSSGHSILDEAARKAVRTWKFRPGKLGNTPIESTVRVPVRFYLSDLK